MKRSIVAVCVLAVATAATAGAIGLPGGGGKVDTKKFDELIAKIDEVSADVEAAKAKIDEASATVTSIAEAHGVADLMSDPAAAAGIKDAITEEEKTQLQAQADAIQTIPDDLNAAMEKCTEIMGMIPDALTDLADQITKNPMAAGSLKGKKDKLDEGKAALEQVMAEIPALIESATNLATTVTGLL